MAPNRRYELSTEFRTPFCSIETATVWRPSCAQGMSTAPRTRMNYCCRRSNDSRLKANRSPFASTPPSPSRRSTRRWKSVAWTTWSAFRPIGPGAGDRGHPVSAAGRALPQTLGALQEFPLSGGELVEGQKSCRQGGASPGRAIPARRIHCDEHELAESLVGAVLQQARHGRAVDQRGQAGDELDASVVSLFSGQRSAVATCSAGVQPGELVATARAASQDQDVVTDEFAAAADEDRRAAGQACPVLLAAAG